MIANDPFTESAYENSLLFVPERPVSVSALCRSAELRSENEESDVIRVRSSQRGDQ